MNLRYYLRGLGIGIFVTAIVLSGSSFGRAEALSDDEIREKARELGMTEERTVLSELEAEKQEEDGQETDTAEHSPEQEAMQSSSTEQSAAEGTVEDGKVEEASVSAPSPISAEISASSPSPISAKAAVPTPTPVSSAVGTAKTSKEPSTAGMGLPAEDVPEVVIKINSGEGSYTVCSRLEEAGLIDSASDYDAYLCKNGYDKKMRVGSHTIPQGANEETIARILAEMN